MTVQFDWLYGIQSSLFIKIGVARNINTRLRTMNLYNPHPCKVVVKRRLWNAYAVEKRMHKALAPHAIGREWFVVDAALIRATLTEVIKELHREDLAWKLLCDERQEEKNRKRALKGLIVDSDDENIIPLKIQVNS